jgi:hypothetical protein
VRKVFVKAEEVSLEGANGESLWRENVWKELLGDGPEADKDNLIRLIFSSIDQNKDLLIDYTELYTVRRVTCTYIFLSCMLLPCHVIMTHCYGIQSPCLIFIAFCFIYKSLAMMMVVGLSLSLMSGTFLRDSS